MSFRDRRLGSAARLSYYQTKDGAVRVNDDLLHSVCFVCSHSAKTQRYTPHGTAFLVAFPDAGAGETYLVTARHVIERADAADGAVHLRVNTTDGGFRYLRVHGGWWLSDDLGVDAAVLPFGFDPLVDMQATAPEMFATDEVIARYEIGVGDPLDVVGLFTSAAGRERNRPIVRTGSIAAMPDEPHIAVEGAAPAWVYLAEMRSHGGLSGSPVGVLLGYDRDATGARMREGPGFLLGLIRGHREWEGAPYGAVFADDAGTLNTGIALVTPIQEVTKLLMTDKAKSHRAALAASRGMARAGLDSAEDPRPSRDTNPSAYSSTGVGKPQRES